MTAEFTRIQGASGQRAALEEERDFLIRSLHDLEAERAAGDIDETDYAALRDDYTVRAARLLRRLEAPEGAEPVEGSDEMDPNDGSVVDDGSALEDGSAADDEPATAGVVGRRRRRPWTRWQIATAAAIVVIAAGLVGWQVGHNSSTRQAGQTITGGNATTPGSLSAQQVSQLMAKAEDEVVSDPLGAVKVYNQILAAYPDQPQALTEEGWVFAQAGQASEAQALLAHAETANPTYDPAYGYLGIVFFGQANYSGAVTQLTYYLAHGPNPALKSQATTALKAAKVDAAAAAARSTSTTTAP